MAGRRFRLRPVALPAAGGETGATVGPPPEGSSRPRLSDRTPPSLPSLVASHQILFRLLPSVALGACRPREPGPRRTITRGTTRPPGGDMSIQKKIDDFAKRSGDGKF